MNWRLPWFSRMGLSYIPHNAAGWAIAVVFLVVAIQRFIIIDSTSHSASDTLLNWAWQLLVLGLIYHTIARATTRH
jgi:hypothetical protein